MAAAAAVFLPLLAHRRSSGADAAAVLRCGALKNPDAEEAADGHGWWRGRRRLHEYLDATSSFLKQDGGLPRWFTPVEYSGTVENAPILMFLPGIDGTGLGLTSHHHKLSRTFELWCLHIPVKDRTSFADLVNLVETTVASQVKHSPEKPIYLVGESIGACIALTIAARNPDTDLILILSNPSTSFPNSNLRSLKRSVPDHFSLTLPWMILTSAVFGDPLKTAMENLLDPLNALHLLSSFTHHFSVLSDILPQETLVWKLSMMEESASALTGSRLRSITAQTLILSSANDWLLPSLEEAHRLSRLLPNSEIRKFSNSGHFLFLDDGFDLSMTIKGAAFYRRQRRTDYVSDYVPITAQEFYAIHKSFSWTDTVFGTVMLSTLENGRIVNSLCGIPQQGPVLFVGYHMLLGLELIPLASRLFHEKRILLRGVAHPMIFHGCKHSLFPEKSLFDVFRIMGAVPASEINFFKLLASDSHVLLYPGGVREALHRKGEEYKLFWPEQCEFVRMAAKFGAKIIPFGVVGEDDFTKLLLDYDDLEKVPFLKKLFHDVTNQTAKLRGGNAGEVANQVLHFPGIVPKLPGRVYFLFGKPIHTRGMDELRNRDAALEMYVHVRSEVERCIAFLKEKREGDSYRSFFSRLLFHTHYGFTSPAPFFQL